MSGYPSDEVARRAGVDTAYVDNLVEIGILTPGSGDAFSPGDVLKVRWVESLERIGVPLEGLAAAVRDGRFSFAFMDSPAFDQFTGLSDTTFQQLSERTGISLDFLNVVREAIGFAGPRPEDHVREDELSIVPAIQLQLEKGFRPAVIERWLRVYAENLRRIAEAERDWWRSEVELPMLESGMSEAEMLEAQAELGAQMVQPFERVLLAIYHGQQEHAWRQSFVEDVEASLERAGLYQRFRSPPAIAFLDISGYTLLTEERGDEAAAELATKLAGLVQRSSQEHGGRAVKWLGDGVMLYFPAPGDAVLASLDMVEGVASHGLPPAHVGIHAGPVIFQEGDYFGRTVNLASRMADYAAPGQVMVSQEVVDAVGDAPLSFDEIGPVELRGVPGKHRLHAARRGA